MPGGEFLYGEDKKPRLLESFRIGRYPVTNAQYQAFIDHGGYRDDAWWAELHKRIQQQERGWAEPNRPRTEVSWHEAVAFCRWLSAQLNGQVLLPTEMQWEKAARGTDGLEYPWGDGYRAGFANIDETKGNVGQACLKSTTAVGIYPHGASPYGLQDVAGNVWEWCLNEYGNFGYLGDKGRALRGGSWVGTADFARCSFRNGNDPGVRNYLIGFRVLCSSPISAQ